MVKFKNVKTDCTTTSEYVNWRWYMTTIMETFSRRLMYQFSLSTFGSPQSSASLLLFALSLSEKEGFQLLFLPPCFWAIKPQSYNEEKMIRHTNPLSSHPILVLLNFDGVFLDWREVIVLRITYMDSNGNSQSGNKPPVSLLREGDQDGRNWRFLWTSFSRPKLFLKCLQADPSKPVYNIQKDF